jgi:hypothetical protein
MELRSPHFSDQAGISQRFTCDGDNISPTLEWSDVPAEAVELALICEDPDAPGKKFVHWMLWGIDPGSVTRLSAGDVPAGCRHGRNDFGDKRLCAERVGVNPKTILKGALIESRCQLVLVEQTAEAVPPPDMKPSRRPRSRTTAIRRIQPIRDRKADPSVGPVTVVMVDVGRQHALEMAARENEKPVQTLPPHGPNPTLGECVRSRCLDRSSDHLEPLALEDLIEGAQELGVMVVNQKPDAGHPFIHADDEVSRLLCDPRAVGIGGTAGKQHLPGRKLDEEEHIQPPQKDLKGALIGFLPITKVLRKLLPVGWRRLNWLELGATGVARFLRVRAEAYVLPQNQLGFTG